MRARREEGGANRERFCAPERVCAGGCVCVLASRWKLPASGGDLEVGLLNLP